MIAYFNSNASVEAKDAEGMTALHFAAEKGSEECCNLLIIKEAQTGAYLTFIN